MSDDRTRRVIARVRAALVLISPDHITPMGRRILDQVLDQETSFLDEESESLDE